MAKVVAQICCERDGRITYIDGVKDFNPHEEVYKVHPNLDDEEHEDEDFEEKEICRLEEEHLRKHNVTHVLYSEEFEEEVTLEEYLELNPFC